MNISTIKEAWLEGLLDFSKIKWLSILFESGQRNMRSITELVSLELSAYWVETWLTKKESFRLKEPTTFIRILL